MPVLTKEWEEKVRANYKPREKNKVCFETFYDRHPVVNRYLEKYVKTLGKDINALIVGIGRENDEGSPSEHIELANIFYNKDYKLTIIDYDAQALYDAVKIDDVLGGASIEWVEQPKIFNRKKKDGDIRFVLDDIVTADLKPYGPFDIIHCINVLCHIGNSDNEAILALWNMARNMKAGGLMIVDDANRGDEPTLFKSRLNRTILKEMQLKSIKKPVYNKEEGITYYFYRKT